MYTRKVIDYEILHELNSFKLIKAKQKGKKNNYFIILSEIDYTTILGPKFDNYEEAYHFFKSIADDSTDTFIVL